MNKIDDDDLESIFKNKNINRYMESILLRSKDAMDLQLWDEAVEDAIEATEMGVTNDDEYRRFHYIDRFVEDILNHVFDVNLTNSEQKEIKKYMFNLGDKLDFTELTSFYAGVLKWLSDRNKLNKEAYPNKGGLVSRHHKFDLSTWAHLATEVRKALVKGMDESKAVHKASLLLPEMQRLDFIAWYRFKFGKFSNVYDVNKIIERSSEGNMNLKEASLSKFALVYENEGRYFLPEFNKPITIEEPLRPFQNEDENSLDDSDFKDKFNSARAKLVKRTIAIDKLLEMYSDVLSPEQIGSIEDALNALRKSIRSLRLASVARDVMIRTGMLLERQSFFHGAAVLYSIADHKPGLKKIALDQGQLAPILEKLQEISNSLRRKDIVRDIARIDFQLHDMDVGSFFPELAEAQAKLVDATGYATNKVEDVISKLRSSKKENEAPKPSPLAPTGPEPIAPKGPETPKPPLTKEPTPAPASATPAPVSALERELARE